MFCLSENLCHLTVSYNSFSFILQVPISLRDSYMGYGAVVPDGYGCSYNLQSDFAIFCIGSFFSCEETSSLVFAGAIEESMTQMKELFAE